MSAGDVIIGASDNCAVSSKELNQTEFSCADRGLNVVLATVTDVVNLTTSYTTEVMVSDLEAPSLQVRPSFDAVLNSSGVVVVTVENLDLGTSDNCELDSLTLSATEFGCADVGGQVVTFTAVDTSGLSSSADVNVSVVDSAAPTLSVQDVSLVLNATGHAAVLVNDAVVSVSDNCDSTMERVEPTVVSCGDLGTVAATAYSQDASGNEQSEAFVITVEDQEAPSLSVVGSFDVTLDDSGDGAVSAGDLISSSDDNCGVAVTNVSLSSFTCADVGVVSVDVFAFDGSGNMAQDTVPVSVEDVTPPALTTPATLSVTLNGDGERAFSAGEAVTSASDNCAVASTTVNRTLFTCADVGEVLVAVNATDVNGLSTVGKGAVTVQDTTSPTVDAVSRINITIGDNGLATLSVADVLKNATDNCGIGQTLLDREVFSCSDVNVTHEVTLTVFDVFGRSTSVAVDVVVLDSELPAVSTAPTTKVLNSGGHVSLLPSDVNTGSTDVCGVASSAVTPSSFSCDDVGVNVVALSVTDVYDNVKTAFENVTVLDETAPSLSVLPSVTRTLNAAGAGTLAASNIDDSTSDACGVAELAVNKTVLSCADVGVLPVLFTAVDVNGNNASVVVDVEVTDEVAPALSLTDLTVQLNSSGLAAINQSMVDTGSSDACGIASFVLSQTVFSCATVGDNTVTVTVTDVNGNVASDSVNVHVVDTESPVVATQDVTLTLDGIIFVTISTSKSALSLRVVMFVNFFSVDSEGVCSEVDSRRSWEDEHISCRLSMVLTSPSTRL